MPVRPFAFRFSALLGIHCSAVAALSIANAGDSTPALPAGHSVHGEVFNEGPRQAAYLMPGMAPIRFQITASQPLAQKFFEQGVCQLHGFWHFEAERSFRQAAKLDPNCAMAYWGMALANIENENRAKGFAEKAAALKARVTAREVLWIEAIAAFFTTGKKDDANRRKTLVKDLERIVQRFPDEIEAKAFLAWALWANSQKGVPIQSYQAVDAIIAQVLAEQPMHPGAHHYRIHLWDNERAENALAASARSGQSAPGIAHQWHMAGHIYSKLKRYADAAYQQEASARVDHAQMIRDRIMPYQIHNYAHNNQWLASDLANVGRVAEAIAVARNLVEIPRHPAKNDINSGNSCAKMGRDKLTDFLPRFELWSDVLELHAAGLLDDAGSIDDRAKTAKLLVIAALRLGREKEANAFVARLEALRKIEPSGRSRSGGRPARKGSAAKKAEKEAPLPTAKPAVIAKKIKSLATQPWGWALEQKAIWTARGFELAGAGKPVVKSLAQSADGKSRWRAIDQAIAEIDAHKLSIAGKHAEAFAAFEKLGRMPKSFLARLALDAGNERAEKLAREAVDGAVKEVEPLATKVAVLWTVGKKDEAKKGLEDLRRLAGRADLSLPVFSRLRPVLAASKLTGDWRVNVPSPDDVGIRPAIAGLGPLSWTPAKARPFTVEDPSGKTVALDDFRGRPVILVFYLGVGCVHCVEQLQKFAPLAEKLRAAGIEILGVSTDTTSTLKTQPIRKKGTPDGFPFTLTSDADLHVFKHYRAFDDFEGKPLHAVFLVDGAGNVRWQEVSFEPFAKPEFLLDEAKRLLAISAPKPAALPHLTTAAGGN